MVVWGAFWGAVLGLLWPGHDSEFQFVVGAVLGALAGLSLRRALRSELQAQARLQQAGAAAPAVPMPQAATAPAGPPARFEPDVTQPLPAPVAAQPEPIQPATAAVPQPRPARQPAPPRAPGPLDLLVARARDWLFGGNTVVRMGVLVLFIGLAFLARYAVEHALLPPQLRLAAIGAAGIGLFVAGLRLRRKGADKLGYALTLQGAGVAVLYLTVFAAFRFYQFLPAGAAFVALGLICAASAAIALAQNAQSMAFVGFAGGFAAPLLVSTGQGSHVALFSYYLLLGVAIAAIAWLRAWRALNLLGFFATFGIATAWGVLAYEPRDFATTEPFLLGFFAVYLLACLAYALRHSHAPRQAVDATLLFGVPIATFGLQAALVRDTEYAMAVSALGFGALYLALGWWLALRRRGAAEVNRWLAEGCAALGLGFVTLAVPLALDGRWTSAVWAVEGAGVYWMGRRQGRWLARATGLALQLFAAGLFLDSLDHAAQGQWPFANPRFVGATLLALAAFGIAWWARTPAHDESGSGAAAALQGVERALRGPLFWVGFLWWQVALFGEIGRTAAGPDDSLVPVLGEAVQGQLALLAWVGSAFLLHLLALPRRAQPWAVAATPAWTVLPAMLLVALWQMAMLPHAFAGGGWFAWPLALLLHALMLRNLDAGAPQRWWPWVHAGGVWLLVLLAGNALVFAIGKADLWQTAWATVILLVAGTVVLLALGSRRLFAALGAPRRWPLNRFARAYAWRAAAPVAACVALGALAVAVHSNGDARPLPYVPLVNPTDLAVGLALAACALWLVRLRASPLVLPRAMRSVVPPAVLGGIAFIALNTVWLRVAHHWGGVPWDAGDLFGSFLVQAGYSILWSLLALVLMVAAHRRAERTPWLVGAGLLALTVLKLFVVDLSNRGGTERIVVFIAVGLLMLVVGWFAPLPPAARRTGGEDAGTGAPEGDARMQGAGT